MLLKASSRNIAIYSAQLQFVALNKGTIFTLFTEYSNEPFVCKYWTLAIIEYLIYSIHNVEIKFQLLDIIY